MEGFIVLRSSGIEHGVLKCKMLKLERVFRSMTLVSIRAKNENAVTKERVLGKDRSEPLVNELRKAS